MSFESLVFFFLLIAQREFSLQTTRQLKELRRNEILKNDSKVSPSWNNIDRSIFFFPLAWMLSRNTLEYFFSLDLVKYFISGE